MKKILLTIALTAFALPVFAKTEFGEKKADYEARKGKPTSYARGFRGLPALLFCEVKHQSRFTATIKP